MCIGTLQERVERYIMKELEYPFDAEYILKKKKSIKKALLSENAVSMKKRIAVLGGSTTSDIVRILDLFLLNQGIQAEFYESEYNKYWEDAMFGNNALQAFSPDLIYIHVTNRNIQRYPEMQNSREEVEYLLESTYQHYEKMWVKLEKEYHCPIIQNNFEFPAYRILGNREAYDYRGKVNFINRLNEKFYQYADTHISFFIQDLQYLSACYGLEQWSDSFYWHMYKYAPAVPAIPYLAHNLTNIIKSIYGRNKKAFVLDLDNTLWGGVVGDDGVEHLEIGQETACGQTFGEFQNYLKECASIGIMLNVASKNEYENAIAGLKHPESILKPDDFIIIKANWETKGKNVLDIAQELKLMPDSLVFVDDNPAERENVRQLGQGIAIPELETPEGYIRMIDKAGYFEVTNLSEDDMHRNEMYKSDKRREELQSDFTDYQAYLESLEMKAVIKSFEAVYMSRIAQLTNKSNQFNLTTKRYSQTQIEQVAASHEYICLYGKLKDKFGDNGVVSVVIGHIKEQECHIDLWIMSCRVLKRDMEYAMFDKLVNTCQNQNIKKITGYYYPTQKNKMVKDFYLELGFEKVQEDEAGNTEWIFQVTENYIKRNQVIEVVE